MLVKPHIGRFVRSAGAYSYGQIATIVVQFIQVPLFLKYFGVQQYAEWLVVTGIPLTMGLLDMGVAQASATKSTMAAGRSDWNDARNTLKTAQYYTLFICVLIILVSIGISKWIDIKSILKLDLMTSKQASMLTVLMALYIGINLQGGVFGAWMSASGKMAINAFIDANSRILDTLIIAIVLVAGGKVITVGIGLVLSAATIRVIHYIAVKKTAIYELRKKGEVNWFELKQIIKPALGYLGFPVAQIVTLQGSLQILNQIASPMVVVGFTTTRTLTRLILNIGAVSSNALKPELSKLIGSNQLIEAKDLCKKVALGSGILAFITYFSIIGMGPWIINKWTAGKVDQSHLLVAVIGLHALMNVLWYVPVSFRIAENKHSLIGFIYLGASIFSIIIWWLNQQENNPIYAASIFLAAPEFIVLMYFHARKTHVSTKNI
jgi:O-antigen/teichoic acid export membrane protein